MAKGKKSYPTKFKKVRAKKLKYKSAKI